MARKPPRITSTRRQRTTRGGPVVRGTTPQPTTGRGRIVRAPSLAQVLAPSWGRPAGAAPPAGGGGSTAAPATPAAPQYSLANLPPDASYEQAIALLQRQRDEGLAGLLQQRQGSLLDYGFREGPNGALTFDPNNPRSKAAELKRAYDTNRRSTGQSLASQGQLYSGAYQNAQDLVNRNQLGAEDTMQKSLIGFLARNTQARKQTLTGYETSAQDAYGDRIGRFQANPLYDPAASSVDPVTGSPAAASAPAAAARATTPRSPASIAAALRRRQAMTGLRLGRI